MRQGGDNWTTLQATLRQARAADETANVRALLAEWQTQAPPAEPIRQHAGALIERLRAERPLLPGVDQLMHEFSLASDEGIALMCLAEALLRIPDSATADRLIRDKLARGHWQAQHRDEGGTLFLNAAAWGLLLGQRWLAEHEPARWHNALERAVARGGEAVIRAALALAMRLLGEHFVIGESIAQALHRAGRRTGAAVPFAYSFDMLGEAALCAADVERYEAAYRSAVDAVAAARSAGQGADCDYAVSIKLSALHPRYEVAQRERVLDELLPRLRALLLRARAGEAPVTLDAEESARLDLSLELLCVLLADDALAEWHGLGLAVQAYRRDAPALVTGLIELARATGRRLAVRLVKGAYWDSEIKRAQVEGLRAYPVFTRKAHIDLSYLVCAARLLAAPDAITPQFATHNAQTLASVLALAAQSGWRREDFECQCLHGMGEALYAPLLGELRCRVYAPVGSHASLLPYLVRRLLENGANSNFVNRLADPRLPVEELCRAPAQIVAEQGGTPHPALPLPGALYPDRRNAVGLDMSDADTLTSLAAQLDALRTRRWHAEPMLAEATQVGAGDTAPVVERHNPADPADIVGTLRPILVDEARQALDAASAFTRIWAATPVRERAAALQRAADALEAASPALMSLLIREGGKTWGNALAEVREAVDYCRYYAAQVSGLADDKGQLAPQPPGPALCISPWNFPLAIFVGQVAAALLVGRPVLAKPASATPLVAAEAVRLLHAAGVPCAALQLLPGAGAELGAALLADARLAAVVFTGSGEVATQLYAQLAQRPAECGEPPLIAETGGLNALIADSSALPEQLVRDALLSAFDSAGQRCSALRVLCLQDEIVEATLNLLVATLAEWRVGNPAQLHHDIGPLIDADACRQVQQHLDALRARGARIWQHDLPAAGAAGSFLAPAIVEIPALEWLPEEVFGPVLHVLRYPAEGLDALVDVLNATGYGLTLGIHSRIESAVARIVERARVGNIYVNRSQIGAVVGVQPFGGERRSGTGPKAGGPLYLHRLAGTLPEAEALAALTGELPGPTGEGNRYRLRPCGKVVCLGDEAAWQALNASGCIAVSEVEALAEGCVDIDAVLCADALLAREWRLRLSHACSQRIVPVIEPVDGVFPLWRLQREQTISTNTAAAGGNAALMSLAE